MSRATRSRPRDIRTQRRPTPHSCWGHLIVAPLWVAYGANLGTLLRTCDAVGACMGASLNVAVAGSLVLDRLAALV